MKRVLIFILSLLILNCVAVLGQSNQTINGQRTFTDSIITGNAAVDTIRFKGDNSKQWTAAIPFVDDSNWVETTHDSIRLNMPSQDYIFRNRVGFGDRLSLVSGGSGLQNALNMFTKDGNGTDPLAITLFSLGTVEDQTNFEAFKLWYNPIALENCITSNEGGTGAFRPILIAADGQANQLRIETDGDVGINATPAAKLHVKGGSDSAALRIDADIWNNVLVAQELAGSPHVGVFRNSRIAGNDAFSVSGNIAATGNLTISGATSGGQAINLGTNDGIAIGGTDILVGNSGVTEICATTHISMRNVANHETARFKTNDSYVIADDATVGQQVKSEKFSVISQYWDGALTQQKPFEFIHTVAAPSGVSQVDMGFGTTDLTLYDTGLMKYSINRAAIYDARTLTDKNYVDSVAVPVMTEAFTAITTTGGGAWVTRTIAGDAGKVIEVFMNNDANVVRTMGVRAFGSSLVRSMDTSRDTGFTMLVQLDGTGQFEIFGSGADIVFTKIGKL